MFTIESFAKIVVENPFVYGTLALGLVWVLVGYFDHSSGWRWFGVIPLMGILFFFILFPIGFATGMPANPELANIDAHFALFMRAIGLFGALLMILIMGPFWPAIERHS